ncbi:MAG: D-alanyl-D-alanine carboxypeptidase family protein [Acidimicrobiales bacterium]
MQTRRAPLDLNHHAELMSPRLRPPFRSAFRPALRSALRFLLVVLAALVVLAVTLPVGAQEPEPLPENPYERLAELERRKAEAALKVDLLRLSANEVQARLATVEAWVVAQEDVLGAAQAELVEATLAADDARAREEAKRQELDDLEALMAEIAVAAYMRPPQMAALNVVLTHDLASAEKADVMLRAKAQRDEQVADDLAEAEKALGRLRSAADEETVRAEAAAEDAATALNELRQAKLEQAGLAERIKVDLEATTAEIELIGGAEYEAILAVQRQTEKLLASLSMDAAVPLTNTQGITVHADIAWALDALLNKARADGIELAGWGHRTTEQQVQLRRQHCGGEGVSDADAVYGRPAASCSPPTAKPGSSMHELGLAVDFTHAGASISTRESPAFQWLAANAAEYGFKNLPSEPWHWSVNGN